MTVGVVVRVWLHVRPHHVVLSSLFVRAARPLVTHHSVLFYFLPFSFFLCHPLTVPSASFLHLLLSFVRGLSLSGVCWLSRLTLSMAVDVSQGC
jgi:hypothetical protein